MGVVSGIIDTFNSLTMWMPSFLSTLLSACFLVWAASAFLRSILSFVRIIGRALL